MTDYKSILKGKKVIGYLRISTSEAKQGTGLKSQKGAIEDEAKRLGLKVVKWYQEAVSGGRKKEKSRKVLAEMISFILDSNQPSDYIIMMRDYKRWSRGSILGHRLLEPLFRAGVELYSVQGSSATGSDERTDAVGKFDFSLWMALGDLERSRIGEAVALGEQEAAKSGIVSGRNIDVDKPWDFLAERLDGLNTPKGEDGHLAKKTVARNSGASLGWMKKAYVRLQDVRNFGIVNDNPNALEEYLDVINWVKSVKHQYGAGSDQYAAARTVVSGFLMKPDRFWEFRPDKTLRAKILLHPKDFISGERRRKKR